MMKVLLFIIGKVRPFFYDHICQYLTALRSIRTTGYKAFFCKTGFQLLSHIYHIRVVPIYPYLYDHSCDAGIVLIRLNNGGVWLQRTALEVYQPRDDESQCGKALHVIYLGV